ncbi:hypothetical protein COBT_001442 [Conglomerata obtusa]
MLLLYNLVNATVSQIRIEPGNKVIIPERYKDLFLTNKKDPDGFFLFKNKYDIETTEDKINFLDSENFEGHVIFIGGVPLCVDDNFEAQECTKEPYTVWKVKPRSVGYTICNDWYSDTLYNMSGHEYCLTIKVVNTVGRSRNTNILATMDPLHEKYIDQIFFIEDRPIE